MFFTEKDTWYYIMHLVLCCADQRKPTIVYPNLWKHFLNNIHLSANVVHNHVLVLHIQ